MVPVIAELEEIDNWEKNAAGSLLDEHGEQATGRIQQRITDALQRKADNDAVRQKERDCKPAAQRHQHHLAHLASAEYLLRSSQSEFSGLSLDFRIVVAAQIRTATIDTKTWG
jgi:hypothetical protein